MNTLPQPATFEVEGFKNIVEQAPAMLEQNETSKSAAIAFAAGLFESAQRNGMSDALDEQLRAFINKAKTTIEAMNERRKPFTQLVDAVKKRFTSQEAELKQTIEAAQKHRDDYATKKMQERIEDERQAKLKLEKEKELIALWQQAETQLAAWAEKLISENKQKALSLFNGFTLETIGKAIEELDFIPNYPSEEELQHDVSLSVTRLTNAEDLVDILCAVKSKFDWDAFIKRHGTEMEQFKKELTDKIPSKRRELEDMAKADASEKERIEEERRKREEAEKARIAAEEEAARKKAEEEAALRAAAQTANAMIDTAATLFDEKPKVKEGYKITVSSNAAYLTIAQFWMEKQGKTLDHEKLERVTFERMRRFAEEWALKHEEFIDNKMIEYQPIYKAK